MAKITNELSIHIWQTDEGFMYDIFNHDTRDDAPDTQEADSLDGGLCTTTLANALEMATDQAKNLINQNRCDCKACGLATEILTLNGEPDARRCKACGHLQNL